MRTPRLLSAAALSSTFAMACAGGGSGSPPGPAPAPAATAVMQQAARAEVPQPKAPDLTGDYGVSIAYGGQPVDLTLSLFAGDNGNLGGSIYAEQAGTIPFNSLTVTGTRVQASLNSPDGSVVTMDFTITGGVLVGNWGSSAGDGSAMRGRKLP